MKKILSFLLSRTFWTHLGLVLLTSLVLLFFVHTWLKQYTHHGQQLSLPDFKELSITEARQLAAENHFELVITDSVHIVSKTGSIILSQNPKPKHQVKEGRKVYVTVSKHAPDLINIEDLPTMYGENYERKARELKVGYALNSDVVGEIYDKGPPGHIMKVIFNQDTVVSRRKRKRQVQIPKGSTLQFIVSKETGGQVSLPDLVCQPFEAAKFLLSSYTLVLDEANADATVEDYESAYVYRQEPVFEEGKTIKMGQGIKLFLTQDLPSSCQ